MFSWLTLLWNNKLVRQLVSASATVLGVLGAIYWMRDDAADKREAKVRDEHEKDALKQRIEIEESQNDQVKQADAIRRERAPAELPEWMRRNPETD